jgi:diguanylate cyclase (GGDEF)-like protein
MNEENKELDNVRKSFIEDASTSLYNKNYFVQNMNKIALEMIKGINENKINKNDAGTWSILFCDIDALKYVNDTVGHIEADKAIKNIASIIKECIRTHSNKNDTILYPDIEKRENIPIRFGGDEFVIILPNCTKEKAQLIKNRINNYLINKSEDVANMTLSIGIADTSEVKLLNNIDINDVQSINMFVSSLIEVAEERMRDEKNIDFDNLSYIKKQETISKHLNRIPGLNLNDPNHICVLDQIINDLKNNLYKDKISDKKNDKAA